METETETETEAEQKQIEKKHRVLTSRHGRQCCAFTNVVEMWGGL